MIVDKDTNQVFVSEWLQKVHPAFFSRFSELLKNVHINMRVCHKSVTHPFLFFAFSQIRNL